jgi:hypothetical protein
MRAEPGDQMCAFTPDFQRSRGGNSPSRLDALVWALTGLMVEGVSGWNIIEFYRRQIAATQGVEVGSDGGVKHLSASKPATRSRVRAPDALDASHVFTLSGHRTRCR